MDGLDTAIGRLDEGQRALVAEFAGVIAGDGQPIRGLRPQEGRLVHVLMAAGGRVLTLEFLAASIAHDPLNPPMDQTANVVLHRVRRKRPDIGRHIQTVWGVGRKWVGNPVA